MINSIDIYKLFLQNIPYPVWICDTDLNIIFVNKHYENINNIKSKDVIGKKNKDLFPEDTAKLYDECLLEAYNKKDTIIFENHINDSYIDTYVFPMIDENSNVQGIAGISVDVSDKKQKQKELVNQKNILRTIIDTVPEAIFYKDKDCKYIGYNKAFGDVYTKLGITDIIGKTDMDILSDRDIATQFIEQDKLIMSTKKPMHFQYSSTPLYLDYRTEESIKTPIIDNFGEVLGLVGLSRDITKNKKLEDKLRYLSEIDVLTGLYNRNSFEEKICELNHHKYHPLGIIMGDVNGLKVLNDTLGHLEGDKLLKNIASVLKTVIKDTGYIFRWGGDEFIILIPNCDEYKCEKLIKDIKVECTARDYEYMQLSIALGENVKYDVSEDIYDCINKVEDKVYRQKLLERKSIKSSVINSLMNSLEEKNLETNAHANRVVKYALAIGEKLRFKISQLDELTLVAKLHDIGKIGISEDILLKEGKLTDEEYEIMKTHTEKGYRIINASSELGSIAKCVLTHHEKWDGSGYPLGLKEEEIPLIARIVNIADSYDVMTTDRPYKKAMSKGEAISELKRCSKTQFDPTLVEYFIDILTSDNGSNSSNLGNDIDINNFVYTF